MKRMLVVARKYNDIFYAFSTEEWQKCESHYLLFITDRLDSGDYPLASEFDEVKTVHINLSRFNIPFQIRKIKKALKGVDYDVITTSNLATIINLYILKLKKRDIILLEDGLMNYYHFIPSNDIRKRFLKFIYGISEKTIIKKITKTYLLKPEEAVYFYGDPVQLIISKEIYHKMNVSCEKLNGKTIFVGQDLYVNQNITVQEYCGMVNKIVKSYAIDYYIPHTMSMGEKNINCEIFDVTKDKITLEIYAANATFKLYSVSSSVLYTTKLINPRVETFAIKPEGVRTPNADNIIYKLVSGIIDL